MAVDPRDLRIQQLEAENQALRQRVQELEQLVAALEQRLEQLTQAAARQAAPFRRKDKDKKPPDEHKPPGRKPGHPPAFRPTPPQVDEHLQARLDQCPKCTCLAGYGFTRASCGLR